MKKSFFEHLGLADLERIHSQFLAWVFSPDCDAFDKEERNILFENIFKESGQIKDIITEQNGIDILIFTTTDLIVIENKIKASQHSNQLNKYREFCDKDFPNLSKHYFFLTLIGEKAIDTYWKPLSYSKILEHLSKLKLKTNNNHSAIINEYKLFLENLDIVVSDFRSNVKKYDFVFLDGHKRKQDKKRSDYNDNENEIKWFIASNQLETILQKNFLSLLAAEIVTKNKIPIEIKIGETRGAALIDFILCKNIEFEGKKYKTLIELQRKNLKFTFLSDDYNLSVKASIKNIVPLMTELLKTNDFNYNKLNLAKKYAYVSISKRIDESYWHKSVEDLANFILLEIENGNTMSNQLRKSITLL